MKFVDIRFPNTHTYFAENAIYENMRHFGINEGIGEIQ